jgi:4-aminobutyrate aminotransferase-like enzyme
MATQRDAGSTDETRAVGGPAPAGDATPEVATETPLDLDRPGGAPESFEEGTAARSSAHWGQAPGPRPASWRERHQAALFPSTALYYEEPLELRRGERQFVFDADGRRYLDLFGGIVTVISGHAIGELTEPIKEQLDRIMHSSTLFLIPSQIELAERIVDMTRESAPGIERVFFTNSGTEANEAAFLLATLARGNSEILALRHSYHGRSFATASASGQAPWRPTANSPVHVHYTMNAYCYRCPLGKTYPSCEIACARDLEPVIQTATGGHPAALIAEPIQGLGGFITPPPEYFQVLKEILDRYGVLFIADEVQTGWGRLGEAAFGFEYYGVEPDLFVFAKGLGNGLPIGGVAATDELARGIRSLSISTFGGNPVCTTGALANLRYIERHDLQANARRVGDYFFARLGELQERHPLIGEVRGKGLLIGIELVTDRASKQPATRELARIMDLTRERGLIVGKGGLFGNVIRLSPPLIITTDDVDFAIGVFDEVFGAVEATM